jgi:hypothetical protein
MNFALERTDNALSLLALENTAAGYRIYHFDKRPLPKNSDKQISVLQEMISISPETITDLIVGIHDVDLIIRHIHVPHMSESLKIHQYCQGKLAQELPLKDYSWDACKCETDETEGYNFLCAAYPLRKIIYLQKMLTACQVHLRALEPSICAVARLNSELSHHSHENLSSYIQREGEHVLAPIGLAMRGIAA